mgnify:FL=1|tara:strand:- start:352 stop:570 length:219 start_codon:yes stop_codon:yes gene_type:complete
MTFDEIISTLAKCGRPDLIMELKQFEKKIVDEDYDPSKERIIKEKLSDSEGSADEEGEYDVFIDDDGFQSLK